MMKMVEMKSIVCAVYVLLTIVSATVRYDGYQVLHIVPLTTEALDFVNSLHNHFEEVEFWKTTRHLGHPVDIMVPPHKRSQLEYVLESNGIEYTVNIANVQDLMEERRTKRSDADHVDEKLSFDYYKYHTYDEIMQWASDIAAEYSNIVKEIVVGKSFEDRDIKILKIGSQASGKPAVYIQGGIHAREWISPATVMFIVKELVANYESDDDVTSMLNGFDWYIVPVLNVDGYSYTWTNDRLWRKNRNADKLCVGVDLNRNYDYEWGGAGASDNPCSDTYCGERALSEPELQAVTNFLLDRNDTQPIHAHLDFHSYGQYWIYPWGYSTLAKHPAEEADMLNVARRVTNALSSVYGTQYTIGGSAEAMYAAAGSSEDWAYGHLGAKYAYIVELRDEGQFGFLLPERLIEPTVIETFAAIKEMGKILVSEYVP